MTPNSGAGPEAYKHNIVALIIIEHDCYFTYCQKTSSFSYHDYHDCYMIKNLNSILITLKLTSIHRN